MNGKDQRPMPPDVLSEFNAESESAEAMAVRVWDLLGELEESPPTSISTEEALKDIEARIDSGPDLSRKGRDRMPRKNFRKPRTLWAVSGVMISAMLILVWGLNLNVVLEAPHGEQVVAELPDGSHVQMNSGSRIEYKKAFQFFLGIAASARAVALEGEAFFDVEPGEVPFEVHTFNASVRVLGTAFNVRSYATDLETRVTLEHGRVEVSSEWHEQEPVLLSQRGDAARVGGNLEEIEATSADSDQFLNLVTAWRSNGFVVIGLPFSSMIEEVERRYNTTLQVQQGWDAGPTDLLITSQHPSLEDVLTDLCLSAQCEFRKNSTGYQLLPLDR